MTCITRMSMCVNLSRLHRNPAISFYAGTLSFSYKRKRTDLKLNQKSTFRGWRLPSILDPRHREIRLFTTAMETDGSNPPESDTSIPEGFVHVGNPNPPDHPVCETEQSSSSLISGTPGHSFENVFERIHPLVGSERDDASADTEAESSEAPLLEAQPKKVLPEELSKNVVFLECESTAEGGSCDVFLVGTAHVSEESCREVQAVVNHLKPQVVFLELCPSRVAILTPQNLEVPTVKEMLNAYKKGNTNFFGILYSWFLAKVAKKLEVFPGSEFRVAFEEAMKYGGKVILGDRPVQITLKRTWGKMTPWHKVKFLYSMLFQAVFLPSPDDLNKMLKEMDDVDMLTLVVQEMSKEFPTMMETLLYERDLYMSSTLLRVASEHSSVVAVVGKGHLEGIKKNWKQHVEVNSLLEIPAQKPIISTAKILTSLGVAVAGAAIISGIYLAAKQ